MVSREVFSLLATEALTLGDVDLLHAHGHDQDVVSVLAAEHAARTQALIRCCPDQVVGRNLLLMIAGKFIADANAIQLHG